NVRRVKARLTTVLTRPFRLRADEAHARAVAVVVDLPFRLGDRADVIVGEEIRGAVRAIEHAQRPDSAEFGHVAGRDCFAYRITREVQGVACKQAPRGVAAELAQLKGAVAVEVRRDVEPAGEQDVAAHTAGPTTERERLP